MSTGKKFLKSDITRKLLCWIGSFYIRFVFSTSSWQVIHEEIPKIFWEKKNPFIICFWHGRLLMMPYCWNFSKTIHLLTSNHRDGRLIAQTVSYFGFRTISGSSSRGGAKALRNMVKSLLAGEYVGLTPDGPRGPRMRARDGVVTIARLSGAPIIPIAFSSNNGKILRSWDRFLFAFPFSRGVFIWGKPIFVERRASQEMQEKARKDVEETLITITNEADDFFNRPVVEPAPILNSDDTNY